MSSLEEGFIDAGDGVFKGKGISALKHSRNRLNAMKALFGSTNLPSSVMVADRMTPDEQIDEASAKRSYKETAPNKGKYVGEFKTFEISGKGTKARGKDGDQKGALSIFPHNIGRTAILFYSNPGDLVVDPFAGHDSRMHLCVQEGRSYVGCDLSHEFMVFNRALAKQFRKQFPDLRIEVHECDSRHMPVEDEVGDFTITCYDEITEVLTKSGWKKFGDVSYEDQIATLDKHNNQIEYQHPNNITSGYYKGPMYRVKTPFVDLRVTPNHNLYVQTKRFGNYELIQAKDLEKKARRGYRVKADGTWTGHEQPYFTIPAIPKTEKRTGTGHNDSEKRIKSFAPITVSMDLFLEFLGYWISEGSTSKSSQGSITLTAKPRNIALRFKKVIDSLNIAPPARIYKEVNPNDGNHIYRIRVWSRRLCSYLKQFGKSHTKHIPRELLSLSKRQLTILFNALMAGDGSRNGNRYWTNSKQLRDDFMEICFKLGYSPAFSRKKQSEEAYLRTQRHRTLNGRPVISRHVYWTIQIKKQKVATTVCPFGWKEGSSCFIGWEEGYEGIVRCVSVPNEIIYVRRNGKCVWCGNSPPYWRQEWYGPEPEQMHECKTYKDFIREMQKVMDENFRCLKPGAFAAWFINDFRDGGTFYSYHSDVIRMGRRAGFVQHDLMIVDLRRGFRDCFIQQAVDQRILPKRHEFGVILRKPLPETERSKTKKKS